MISGHIELWNGLAVGVGEIVFQAMGVAVLHEDVCCPTVGEYAMRESAWGDGVVVKVG